MAKNRFVEILEFVPAYLIASSVRLVNFKRAQKWGEKLGRLMYKIKGLRKTAVDNLKIAFGSSLEKDEFDELVEKSFVHLGMVMTEFMKMLWMDKSELESVVFDEGSAIKNLTDALSKGRGVVAVTGHIGNWEFLGAKVGIEGLKLGFKTNVIVRPLDNRLLDRFVESTREKFGMKIVPKGIALKEAYKALKRGELVAFLSDQNTIENEIYVPFFGKYASVSQGAAFFAHRTGAEMVFAYDRRMPDGTHKIFIEPAPDFNRNQSTDEFVREAMTYFTGRIEEVIREQPEQWLWLHPRWRKRPPWEEKDT